VPRAEQVLDALGREEWETVTMNVADACNVTVLLKRRLLDDPGPGEAAVTADVPEMVVAADAPVAIEEVERVLKESS
jgi:hypothetical protein